MGLADSVPGACLLWAALMPRAMAPRVARCRAVAASIPWLAPVTSATRRANSPPSMPGLVISMAAARRAARHTAWTGIVHWLAVIVITG